jgi:vacuolar protein sorting-associated protein 16
MAHPHPTTTWEAMQDGNTFYGKHQMYIMQWQGLHDLSDYNITVANHGGPIGKVLKKFRIELIGIYLSAMMRDTSKLSVVRPTSNALGKAEVQVWSASGEGLLLFKVKLTPPLMFNSSLVIIVGHVYVKDNGYGLDSF